MIKSNSRTESAGLFVADTYNKKSRAKYTGLNLVHLQGLEPRTH